MEDNFLLLAGFPVGRQTNGTYRYSLEGLGQNTLQGGERWVGKDLPVCDGAWETFCVGVEDRAVGADFHRVACVDGYLHHLVAIGLTHFLHSDGSSGAPSAPCAGELLDDGGDGLLVLQGNQEARCAWVGSGIGIAVNLGDGESLLVLPRLWVGSERNTDGRGRIQRQTTQGNALLRCWFATLGADDVGNGADGIQALVRDGDGDGDVLSLQHHLLAEVLGNGTIGGEVTTLDKNLEGKLAEAIPVEIAPLHACLGVAYPEGIGVVRTATPDEVARSALHAVADIESLTIHLVCCGQPEIVDTGTQGSQGGLHIVSRSCGVREFLGNPYLHVAEGR